jgi:hypothetical protein
LFRKNNIVEKTVFRTLSVFFVVLFCLSSAGVSGDTTPHEIFYEREGDFVVFFGEQSTFVDATGVVSTLYENDEIAYYVDEVILADGRLVELDRAAGDRLLEYQYFSSYLSFRLDKSVPLWSEPSDKSRYSTGISVDPGTYEVRRKAYDYIELIRADGTTGWIRLKENLKSDVVEQPGAFVGAVKVLDDRLSEGLVIREMISPAVTRGQMLMVPEYVTVHNTGNYEPYADAAWHAKQAYMLDFVPEVTYHFVVDAGEAYQMTPLDETTFHAGDRYACGNGASVSIEITDENDSADYVAAEQNGARLAASILYQLGLPKDRLRFHVDWTGKNCPLNMIEQTAGSLGLEGFRTLVGLEYDRLVASYGDIGTTRASASSVRRQVPTIVRRTVVTELDPAGRYVEKEIVDVVEVKLLQNYGWLTWLFAGLFILILFGALITALKKGKRDVKKPGR